MITDVFFARYGEVDPNSITVNVGDKVSQGSIIAKTGLMISSETNRHPSIIAGQTVYMLHFEYYPEMSLNRLQTIH